MTPALFSGCCGSTSPYGGEADHLGPLIIESAPPASACSGVRRTEALPGAPYHLIYPFLNGILRRLEIAGLLSDGEKLGFLQYCSSIARTAQGGEPESERGGSSLLIFRLPGYFERGDLLIRIEYRSRSSREPGRYVWRSNALANPATGRPLRGRGGCTDTGPLRNIGGTILRLPGRLVSASDLYSRERDRRLREGGELLLLAHMYLFDELPGHRRWAKMLAESILSTEEQPRERRAAALCLLARLMLMEERYPEAGRMLARAEPLCAAGPAYLSRLLRAVREEHRLAKALALQYH